MTVADPRERITVAERIAARLRDLVHREAPRGVRLAWSEQFRRLLDILGADDEPDEILKYAALAFDQLYSGGRNFADFVIQRPDRRELVAENERLAALAEELKRLLHGS
ncbi:hypothetical protein [Actinoplanes sp. NPDC049681]|uniref:hypothetical protein n=1 Tax=Actinoplanes sp. NPDC049681 TaxID=3363905 RepID=UPI0037A3E040